MEDLPPLPEALTIIRKIRACDGEAAAQLLLEKYALAYARLAVQQERERCASVCDGVMDNSAVSFGYRHGAEKCAAAIRKG